MRRLTLEKTVELTVDSSVAQAKRNSQFWSLIEAFNLSEAIGALAQDVASSVCG